MRDAIAVLNAGSSSLKFSLYANEDTELALVARGQAEGLLTSPKFVAKDGAGNVVDERNWGEGTKLGHDGALDYLVSVLRARFAGYRLVAVGHRVVHGGLEYSRPTRINAAVVDALEKYVALAPLHQPHNLAPIRFLLARDPKLPQVACFDTAFHRNQPAVAQAFALPRAITERGVLRYGFHGLSYEYIASVLPTVAPNISSGRVIVAHLGSGASLCAIKNGKGIDSTLGFTALDGLCMGTRPGSIDPGVVLYLFQTLGLNAADVETMLYKKSGLLGISGISNDMRDLIANADPSARLAVEYFVYRVAKEIGALAAVLGGVDGIVFTAGIGERSAAIRQRICDASAWLGLEIDRAANEHDGPRISTSASEIEAWVVPTNEELVIARHTGQLLGLIETRV